MPAFKYASCEECLKKQRVRNKEWNNSNDGKKSKKKYKQSKKGKEKDRETFHLRRARYNNIKVIDKIIDIRAIKNKQNNICIGCKRKFDKITATLDHIIPISKGGAHTHSNFQLLCQSCNSQKHDRPMEQFMKMLKPWK